MRLGASSLNSWKDVVAVLLSGKRATHLGCCFKTASCPKQRKQPPKYHINVNKIQHHSTTLVSELLSEAETVPGLVQFSSFGPSGMVILDLLDRLGKRSRCGRTVNHVTDATDATDGAQNEGRFGRPFWLEV